VTTVKGKSMGGGAGTRFVIKADATGHYLGKFEHANKAYEWLPTAAKAARFGIIDASQVASKVRTHAGTPCTIVSET
jgi:hypothetical protein